MVNRLLHAPPAQHHSSSVSILACANFNCGAPLQLLQEHHFLLVLGSTGLQGSTWWASSCGELLDDWCCIVQPCQHVALVKDRNQPIIQFYGLGNTMTGLAQKVARRHCVAEWWVVDSQQVQHFLWRSPAPYSIRCNGICCNLGINFQSYTLNCRDDTSYALETWWWPQILSPAMFDQVRWWKSAIHNLSL